MKRTSRRTAGRKSVFRALFAPLVLIMVLQGMIFYFAAVYGGIEESLSQNAVDVLSERLFNRAYEIETKFNSQWTDLAACEEALDQIYADYENRYGAFPLTTSQSLQITYLEDASASLINTLRHNEVNGIFLILNDQAQQVSVATEGSEQKYGLCIRDMDQDSYYSGREDLQLERAPSSIIESLGCALDSWWEAKYTFPSEQSGDYYYQPLSAAWAHPNAAGRDLMYCSESHRLSGSDPAVVSASIPLMTDDGYPYAVLGVEITNKHLASLLPNQELNKADKCCYILSMQYAGSDACEPILGVGTLYNRGFDNVSPIVLPRENATGSMDITGRNNIALTGKAAYLNVYNNNSPFENRRLVLLALVEHDTLFVYLDRVKLTLLVVSAISLLIGVAGILMLSRRFAAPITALAKKVRGMKTQPDFRLERLGITEIDQLVDAIEDLNRNVGRGSARTEFFSRMSHDMRTPMNAIISFSSPELLEGASDALKDDYLQKIHASGQYLLALINEVLDITKIESNKTELHMSSVQACMLFATTIPIIEKLAQKKHIQLHISTDAEPQVYVKADVLHLNQIVMNLLSNAVKFTSDGGSVKLHYALSDDPDNNDRAICHIVISDNGIGMSEEFIERLYTPFEQENSSGDGTGLGLSIARKLVELMDGSIDCQSRKNVGTTFTMRIPLQKDYEVHPASSDLPQPTDTTRSLRGKRILICEDNAINYLIIKTLLEKWGVFVDHAINGKIGLDTFMDAPENTYDAILMDIRMPVMDGLASAKAIRALDRADAKRIPIIAMTADAFKEDEQASRDAGMDSHLTKPVAPDIVFAVLSKYLAQKHGN